MVAKCKLQDATIVCCRHVAMKLMVRLIIFCLMQRQVLLLTSLLLWLTFSQIPGHSKPPKSMLNQFDLILNFISYYIFSCRQDLKHMEPTTGNPPEISSLPYAAMS
jgi:hypothetical protein